MLWIIVALVSLLTLCMLALLVPLDFILRAEMHDGVKLRVLISWLFLVVKKDISRRKKPRAEIKPAAPRRTKRGPGVKTVFQILRVKGLARQLKRLVLGLLRHIHLKRVVVDLGIGLGEPADTGMLFAVVAPLVPFLSATNRAINLQPSFEDRAHIEGYSYARVRVQPLLLAVPVARFVLSMPALRVARIMVRQWRARKE